jgi:hypothetical protein
LNLWKKPEVEARKMVDYAMLNTEILHAFEVIQLVVQPHGTPEDPLPPGTAIEINCSIKSKYVSEFDGQAKISIFKGGDISNPLKKFTRYIVLSPGSAVSFSIPSHVEGVDGPRDVHFEFLKNGSVVCSAVNTNAFYIRQQNTQASIQLLRPTTNPPATINKPIYQGMPIYLTTPVRNLSGVPANLLLSIEIKEGVAPNTILEQQTTNIFLKPGEAMAAITSLVASGFDGAKSVSVKVIDNSTGRFIAEQNFEDVFWVADAKSLKGHYSFGKNY